MDKPKDSPIQGVTDCWKEEGETLVKLKKKAGEKGRKLGGCGGQGIAPYMLKAGVLVFLAVMVESRYRSLIKGWAPGARREIA